ncbi:MULTISPECIES: hypothetical protein [unclassified Streptomyces]|uniref:hypothetical protein n=1 Tax=unclassified Streptomyces TaxID=2593676 RepID=UPI00386B9CB1
MVTMTDRHPETAQHDASPSVGAVMVDRRNGRVGVVMGHVGSCVQLRPPRGGLEWDVPPEDVRPPTTAEELSAKVAVANQRWGR